MSRERGPHREETPDNQVATRVQHFLDSCSPQGTIYLGLSGGLDSSVLLHAVAKQSRRRVCALHAHHGLHTDADLWQQHCQSVCDALQVPLRTASLSVSNQGKGLEAAARNARYCWFESCVGRNDMLVLAHHQDDQVETVLLRLLRGAGPRGLAAMASVRSIGEGQLFRPFLDLPQAVLARYGELHRLSWIDDPSNTDLRFDRNFLRSEVLPLLEQRWPGYRKTVSRAARQLRELEDDLPAKELAHCKNSVGDPGFVLNSLPGETPAAARAIRSWLRSLSLSMPSAAKLSEFQRQLEHASRARMATGEWVLERYRDAVYAYLPRQLQDGGPWQLAEGGALDVPGCGRVSLHSTRNDSEVSEAFARLQLRFREGGERLQREDGHHSDLKHIFQSRGVPPWWRDRLPLLVRVDKERAELLAVGPFERSLAASTAGLSLRWQPLVLGEGVDT